MTALSDFLNDHKGEDFNVDARVAAAAKDGHAIDRATVFKVLNGDHARNPREATLAALAAVFELDVRDVREAAGKPRGELGEWKPTSESARLNQEQRDALDLLIKSIVREGGGAHEHGAAPIVLITPTDETDEAGNVLDAARRSKTYPPRGPRPTE